MANTPIRRCAIYTRKSSEEGLEQDFNSLHAQREACEAFIRSQAGEGWKLIKTAYDDGGLSGGTMERPALQRSAREYSRGSDRCRRRVQGRPAHPIARRFCQDRRVVRCPRRLVRRRDPAIQHDDLDGPSYTQRLACRSRSSSARLPASASATRSPPPSARACGWAARCRSGTTCASASWSSTKPKPRP